METNDLPDTIVAVTNDQGLVQAVSSILEKAGFKILAVSSGASALKRCRKSNPQVHLVIIDSATSGIDVGEFSAELAAISPRIPTLLLTVDDAEAPPGTAGHIPGILRKPFRRSQLLGQVLEMTDRPMVLTA